MKSNGKVIGIMSFKGGVGKTTTAINLAAALSKLNNDVLVIESNFLSPTLHIYTGLLEPDLTLKEIIRADLPPERAIYEHETGIHIMPCNFYKDLDFEKFKKKVDYLKEKYDYIILDSGPNYTEEIGAILMVSDELIFVAAPNYSTLVSTLRAKDLTEHKDNKIKGIVINKKRGKRFELDKKDIEDSTELPVIAEIHDDNKIIKAVSEFMPITHHSPKSKNAKEFLNLARLLSQEYDEQELARLLKIMKEEANE
jgi:septum site-determining protein MinD